MFEQQPTQQPPQSMKKPEDMFASTDPAPNASQKISVAPQNLASSQPSPVRPLSVAPASSSKRKNMILFLLIVVFVGVGVGALAYVFTRRSVKLPEQPVSENQQAAVQNQEPIVPQPGPQQPIDSGNVQQPIDQAETQPGTIPPAAPVQDQQQNAPIDQDQDGLTLQEEIDASTSDNLSDTDLDGLTDWDELRVYKSSPVNADTDADGYIDGHEVKNGYSPTGPGKLQEIPQQ